MGKNRMRSRPACGGLLFSQQEFAVGEVAAVVPRAASSIMADSSALKTHHTLASKTRAALCACLAAMFGVWVSVGEKVRHCQGTHSSVCRVACRNSPRVLDAPQTNAPVDFSACG